MPFRAKSTACTAGAGASVGVGGAAASDVPMVREGDRLCLCRYEAEFDLGGWGLPVTGDRGGSSLYEELRLIAGLVVLDDAGDCCDGGVYGISPAWRLRGVGLVGRLGFMPEAALIQCFGSINNAAHVNGYVSLCSLMGTRLAPVLSVCCPMTHRKIWQAESSLVVTLRGMGWRAVGSRTRQVSTASESRQAEYAGARCREVGRGLDAHLGLAVKEGRTRYASLDWV